MCGEILIPHNVCPKTVPFNQMSKTKWGLLNAYFSKNRNENENKKKK